MSDDTTLRVPIKLRPTPHPTIWGGRGLASVAGKALPAETKIGESWETEVGNRAENPPYEGADLGSLVRQYGVRLLGERAVEVFGERFPLLAKFIDANDQLSVQVHPDDAYARDHEGGKLGKTEAWYILHAQPGARIVYGLEHSTTPEEVRRAIADSQLERLLHEVVVREGDVVFVPAGTVHAIGAGIILYELQEYSDVTYRLYDYGRLQTNGQPRELHIEQSLAVMRYEPSGPAAVRPVELPAAGGAATWRALVGCRYFLLQEGHITGDVRRTVQPSSCEIITVLDGTLRLGTESTAPLELSRGETAVLPAELGGYTLIGDQARVLQSYVPQESDPVLRSWLAAQVGERAP